MRRNYPTQCAAMIGCAGWSCRENLNWRRFKIANGWSIIFKMSLRSQLAGRLALSPLEPVVPPLSQVKARLGEQGGLSCSADLSSELRNAD
jgi:hypothetical protein